MPRCALNVVHSFFQKDRNLIRSFSGDEGKRQNQNPRLYYMLSCYIKPDKAENRDYLTPSLPSVTAQNACYCCCVLRAASNPKYYLLSDTKRKRLWKWKRVKSNENRQNLPPRALRNMWALPNEGSRVLKFSNEILRRSRTLA